MSTFHSSHPPVLVAQRGSVLRSLVGIVVCGVGGGVAGWAAVQALDAEGAFGAIVAAVVAMAVAFAAWAGGVALLRAMGWIR